jgi:signal transduction histidine kinase
MSTDAKSAPSPGASPSAAHHGTGIRIFMWPKVIFLYPTALVALLCGVGMGIIHDHTHDPTKPLSHAVDAKYITGNGAQLEQAGTADMVERFRTPQNLLAMLFLAMFAFNLIVMALDFPRFSLVAVILAILFVLFFILWLGSYFHLDLLKPINAIFSRIYAVANKGFYFMVFATLMFVFLIIYITRWLDYWEILPNEILHHHGPLSDLERYPTMNLKFDKEIPDVLEWAMLGSGRLVLHVPNVAKALVLDNVLFISAKERALKSVMSRLEVRVTTDQEAKETET